MSSEFAVGDEFARVLTDTTQALVCVLDGDGRILLFNDSCVRSTGYSREEVIGRDAREVVIPTEEAEAFGDVLAYIWRTGLSSPQVGNWLTKDGGRRLIAWSNKLMPGADEGTSYLVTTGIDVTENPEGAFEGDVEAKLAEVGRLAQEQRALRRVATLVASEATPERVFTAVSEETARVLEVNASAVFRYEGDDTATVVGRHDREHAGVFDVGDRIFADDNTAIGRARDTGLPARINDYFALETDVAKTMREVGYRSAVAAPIFVGGVPWGAVAIAAGETLPDDSEARLMTFSELASLAVASAQAREDLQSSRSRIVKAGDEQRRKLERNLHDGAQQRLVSLALTLRLAHSEARVGTGLGARADPPGRRRRAGQGARGAARAGPRPSPCRADGARALVGAAGPGAPAADRGAGGRARGTAARPPGGHGVLHRLRGADERREARPGDVGARDVLARRRRPALRDHGRRMRRSRPARRLRHPRAARSCRSGGRDAVRDQPAGQGHGRDRDAAAYGLGLMLWREWKTFCGS